MKKYSVIPTKMKQKVLEKTNFTEVTKLKAKAANIYVINVNQNVIHH